MVRYYCKYCDYDAGTRKSSYTKHLLTIKHQKALKTRFPPEDREELQSRIDEFDWYYTKNDDNLSDALSS